MMCAQASMCQGWLTGSAAPVEHLTDAVQPSCHRWEPVTDCMMHPCLLIATFLVSRCCCRIAVEESNTNDAFALKGLDTVDRTVWATLLVGLSLHEAGLIAWELKLRYMGSRPITGIQCGLSVDAATGASRTARAWRGPYMGVGRRSLSSWQPFQPINFLTPPFSGYVSGHATFSSAAAEVGTCQYNNFSVHTWV